MSKFSRFIQSPMTWIAITVLFYFTGFMLIDSQDVSQLKDAGLAEQEEYVVTNQDGEEFIEESLIDIKGLGKVLTYQEIYLFSIPLFFASMILGCIIFNGGEISTTRMSMKHAIFANCVTGLLLIWVTSKANIPSTVLFWFGIFAAGVCVSLGSNKDGK